MEKLTESLTSEILMLFRVASHDYAKTSAQRATELESPEPEAGSGVKWRELSARFDPDSLSWKTHLCLWEEVLPWSSVTLPRWGMMRDGVLLERATSALLTNGTASGFWPTPNCSNDRTPCLTDARLSWEGNPRQSGDKVQARLRDAAAFWPTPKANDAEKRGNFDMTNPRNGLAAAVRQDNPTGGKLNPDWDEWLMGWPISWTASTPLGMAKFQVWLGLHGKPSPIPDLHTIARIVSEQRIGWQAAVKLATKL